MTKIGCFYRDYNDSGGMPLEIKCMMAEIVNLNYNVTVYCYGNKNKYSIEDNGLSIKQFKKPNLFFKLPIDLKNDIVSTNFDLFFIIAAHIRENYPISHLLIKNNIKYIYSPGGAYNPYLLQNNKILKYLWKFFFELKILNNAKIIRTYSKTNETFIKNYGGTKPTFEVLEGIYDAEIEANIEPFNFKNKKINIIYLGRIDYIGKGIDQLLTCFNKVEKNKLNIKLHIYGPFASNKDKKLFNKKMLEFTNNFVEYHGSIYGKKKYSILKGSDIFIYPSRFEGIPRSIRESLYVGTPVIVTKETNFVEYVNKYQAGFSCLCSSESIYQALEKFALFENKKQLSLNAKFLINEFYNWKSVKNSLSILFKKLSLDTKVIK